QVYASALALINAPIPALFDEQVRYLGRAVEIIAYAPSGTGLLKNNVRSRVRNGHNAYILKNHGALVLGHDAERAERNVELLEKCALAYLLALCTGRHIDRIPLAVREIAFAQLRKDEKRYQ
ncbi:MAG TPA: class II aldolase/adducin family protein, partial [Anaerolineae bacterium]|nr:class II aldolase/adducin family protein [Anaerolineae bacterium]